MKPHRVASGLALSLLALVWTTPALAYRPFDGTDADVAAPHEVELEVGPVGFEQQSRRPLLIAPALVLNYGLAPGFEAVLEGRKQWALHARDRSELEDIALSLKSLVRGGSLQGTRGVSVAIETGLLLPGSESRLGLHVASIFSWRFPALTLHLNLGNNLLTSVRYEAVSSLIVEGPDDWRVRPVGEVLAARDFGQGKLARGLAGSVLVGAVASWTQTWSFDVALRHGRVDGVAEDEVRAGFTWAFDSWWQR
jgi:hypothetical protein